LDGSNNIFTDCTLGRLKEGSEPNPNAYLEQMYREIMVQELHKILGIDGIDYHFFQM
jgi:hypothetical protein